MEQLRTCGVMETLQTNRNWFRVKAPLRDFYLRYRCMVPGVFRVVLLFAHIHVALYVLQMADICV